MAFVTLCSQLIDIMLSHNNFAWFTEREVLVYHGIMVSACNWWIFGAAARMRAMIESNWRGNRDLFCLPLWECGHTTRCQQDGWNRLLLWVRELRGVSWRSGFFGKPNGGSRVAIITSRRELVTN